MNFFERELQKIVRLGVPFENPTYVGGACYGKLGGDLRVKLQFVTRGTHQKYEALQATVINRKDGPVDKVVFDFESILGMKAVPGNPNFRGGVSPYAWTYRGETEWYAFTPSPQDYRRLCDTISDYCGVFQSQEMGGQGMTMSQQL